MRVFVWVLLLSILGVGPAEAQPDQASGTVSCRGNQARVESATAQWNPKSRCLQVMVYPESSGSYLMELNFQFRADGPTTREGLEKLQLFISRSLCGKGAFTDYRVGAPLKEDLVEFKFDPAGRVALRLRGRSRYENEPVSWEVNLNLQVNASP